MTEWNYIILAPLCALLFAIGGTTNKLWRRIGIPVASMVALWLNGITWWRFLLIPILTWGSLCLPYGDSLDKTFPHPINWIMRFGVGCCYVLPLIFIGDSGLMIAYPFLFIILFWLSRKGWLTWKLCELSFGFLLGGVLSDLIS